ncbi:Glyoxalase/bleomycin resistance protein/dioxygenase [Burkholderia cenocepacia PC184]|nr:Glyoxalase/bleomycin resistance protein/dioxygenase [Burkholderia cenocepacia PC184]
MQCERRRIDLSGGVSGSRRKSGTSKRHWCFKAASREQVQAFFEAGLATGDQSDGEPGLRPQYHGDYYAAFLIDPAGNRVEAVCHAAGAERGRP